MTEPAKRKDGRWSLSKRTLCAECGLRIGGASYSCPAWNGFLPIHLSCARPKDDAVGVGE